MPLEPLSTDALTLRHVAALLFFANGVPRRAPAGGRPSNARGAVGRRLYPRDLRDRAAERGRRLARGAWTSTTRPLARARRGRAARARSARTRWRSHRRRSSSSPHGRLLADARGRYEERATGDPARHGPRPREPRHRARRSGSRRSRRGLRRRAVETPLASIASLGGKLVTKAAAMRALHPEDLEVAPPPVSRAKTGRLPTPDPEQDPERRCTSDASALAARRRRGPRRAGRS